MKSIANRWSGLIVLSLILSVISLFVEQMELQGYLALVFTNLIDFTILFILIAELVAGYRNAPYKKIYFKRNFFSLAFSYVFIGLFVYNKYLAYNWIFAGLGTSDRTILLIRNLFLVLKVFSRYRRVATFVERLNIRPALTILFSFLIVILAGTWLLMMPFTARVGNGLSLINALFTATSAVCVTGLVVVDTVSYFSVWGQVVIMILIQIGGLGIMVLSYFTLFVMGKKISVDQKSLVSYMLNEDDMNNLKQTLMSIIGITAIIEGTGMLILVAGSGNLGMSLMDRLFFGLFHSVSAFCNAGFALFSDSLESFYGSPVILMAVALLIISGGLSFGVFVNLKSLGSFGIRRLGQRLSGRRYSSGGRPVLSLNSRIVLAATGALILTGTLLFYALEHDGTLRPLSLGQQYLAAFFQSVTLRTAGFNSIPFGTLSMGVIVVMILYMFIGGASGSTAGGIKVNTFVVILASLRSAWRNENNVIIRSKTIGGDLVNQAYLIFLFGIGSVALGTFVLTLTESAPLESILFETVSAFATVGLTVGLTPNLSLIGKCVIIVLMFIGRLGPLTVLAASSTESRKLQITFPRGNIAIG